MIGADLSGANLSHASLHCARETGAKFDGANMKKTIRTDADRLEAEAWKPKR